MELRANRAADCERGCETATEVLLGGLPEGVRTGELTWEAICWEKTTGMFLRRGVLECRALFLAESAVESGEFLDFRLKGVISFMVTSVTPVMPTVSWKMVLISA